MRTLLALLAATDDIGALARRYGLRGEDLFCAAIGGDVPSWAGYRIAELLADHAPVRRCKSTRGPRRCGVTQ